MPNLILIYLIAPAVAAQIIAIFANAPPGAPRIEPTPAIELGEHAGLHAIEARLFDDDAHPEVFALLGEAPLVEADLEDMWEVP